MFSNDTSAQNGVVQELGLKDKFSFRPLDVFCVRSAELSSGVFVRICRRRARLPGDWGVGLRNGFTPGQSILVPRGQNLSNAFDAELDTKLTPRASLTFVGGYSLLQLFR